MTTILCLSVSNCNLAFMVSILANVSKKKKKIFQRERALPGFIMDKLHYSIIKWALILDPFEGVSADLLDARKGHRRAAEGYFSKMDPTSKMGALGILEEQGWRHKELSWHSQAP